MKTRGTPPLGRVPRIMASFALVAALFAGQYAADTQAGASERGAGAMIERAGFAYLTGVRTFIAAVLWNRLDPILHDYYEEVPLQDQLVILPTIQMVVALDPQFIDGYYVAAWILARRGDVETGLDIAAQGVENNPRSGTMRMNYAQILYLFDGDVSAAVKQADAAVANAEWKDPIEQHDSYAVFGAIYKSAGLTERYEYIQRELVRLDEIIGDALGPEAHDHDGDGVPDH